MARCRWVYDDDIDGGKFLVPGCWSRTIYGDYADCHCEGGPKTVGDQIGVFERRIAKLERRIAKLERHQPDIAPAPMSETQPEMQKPATG